MEHNLPKWRKIISCAIDITINEHVKFQTSNQNPIMLNTWRKSLVYLEGTLNPSISLLENGRDIMLTPREWEENYAYYL
jgi:hypothetical protein